MNDDYDDLNLTIGQRLLIANLTYTGAIFWGILTHYFLGRWIVTVAVGLLWMGVWIMTVYLVYTYRNAPRQAWKNLAQRFPSKRTVTDSNMQCLGYGEFNGLKVMYALLATKQMLHVRLQHELFLRPKAVSIPWQELRIERVGLNGKEEFVAEVSVPRFWNCKMLLPWQKRFTTDSQAFGNSPERSTQLSVP